MIKKQSRRQTEELSHAKEAADFHDPITQAAPTTTGFNWVGTTTLNLLFKEEVMLTLGGAGAGGRY